MFSYGVYEYLGILAGLLSAFAFVPYIYSITQGAIPSLASWSVWTVIGVLGCSSYLTANNGWVSTAWVASVYVVAPLATALMTWWYGARFQRLNGVEITCLIGAFFGVVVWFVTRSATAALLIFIFIDGVGTMPTIVKSYYDPYGESLFAWKCSLLGSICNVFAIEQWTIATASYPTYLALSILTLTLVIIYRRRYVTAPSLN